MADDGEEFDVEAPKPDAAPPSGRSPEPARSAVGFFLLGLVLVAVGIVVAPPPTMTDRGIVPHLDTPPELLWEVPLQSSHATAGHVWIGSDEAVAAGSNSMHGLDLTTGEMLWEVRAPQMQCGREDEEIACVSRQGARSELIEMTMDDGEVDRTVHTGMVAALPYDGGLITLFEESGTVTVMRWGDSGEHRWSHEETGAEADFSGLRMAVLADLVLIQAPSSTDGPMFHLALGVSDGASHEQVQALVSNDHEWLVDREGTITMYDQSGRPSPMSEGGSTLRVDDDPGSNLAFTGETGDFKAITATDSEEIWTFTTEHAGVAIAHARLAGTMVGWSDGTWYGLSSADGALQWSRPGPLPRCPCLGSGSVLAGVSGEEDSVLTGIDVTTGAERWQVPLSQSRTFSYGTDGVHLGVFTVFGLSMWSLT